MAHPGFFDKLKLAGSAHSKDTMGAGIDKNQLKNTYVAFLIVVSMAILIYGLVIVYSAVQNNEDYSYFKQLVGVVIGIVLMLVF